MEQIRLDVAGGAAKDVAQLFQSRGRFAFMKILAGETGVVFKLRNDALIARFFLQTLGIESFYEQYRKSLLGKGFQCLCRKLGQYLVEFFCEKFFGNFTRGRKNGDAGMRASSRVITV